MGAGGVGSGVATGAGAKTSTMGAVTSAIGDGAGFGGVTF
jgi:hypothetical protein